MNARKKGITILAAVGILALLTGAGFSETGSADSHQAHHPQAAEGKGPAAAGCPEPSGAMGGMMSGMMNGMMGNGRMSSPAGGVHSPSGCGSSASTAAPMPRSNPCPGASAHRCANATSAS